MQHLTPVGLSEDGSALVLTSTTGTRYEVPITTLRAALPGGPDGTQPDLPSDATTTAPRRRPGEKTMDSVLRPRDIQTRIRAGESAEAVAEAAKTTVDKIMGFAAPVLAERAYVAEQAQKASVRRRSGEGAAHLGEAVEQRLRSAKIDPASAEWDAWRREDRRWTLVVDYRTDEGDQRAEFVYDAAGRYVTTENDVARWLVGERTAGASSRSGRRSSAFPEDEQLPLGDDAIEVVTGRRPADAPLPLQFDRSDSAAGPEESGSDDSLTEDLTEVRALGRRDATADADWISTQASDRPARPVAAAPEPAAPPSSPDDTDSDAPDSASDETEPRSRRRSGKGKGRASVPSWDEIMFGSGRQD